MTDRHGIRRQQFPDPRLHLVHDREDTVGVGLLGGGGAATDLVEQRGGLRPDEVALLEEFPAVPYP